MYPPQLGYNFLREKMTACNRYKFICPNIDLKIIDGSCPEAFIRKNVVSFKKGNGKEAVQPFSQLGIPKNTEIGF